MADKAVGVLSGPDEVHPAIRKILVIAGEESGDLYGGRLCAHIARLFPGVRIEGIGGPRMRRAGVDTLYDISQMSSVGVASMLGRLRFFIKVLNEFRARIADGEYEAVILIDYPDFNMRIAKSADTAGAPVFYYVCPQFWAWRRYRLRAVRSYVDMMMVVFPFEEEFYTKRRINARFIGHPLLDELEKIEDRRGLKESFGVEPKRTLLGLFPGSRAGEVDRMLSVMLSAVKIIRATKPVKVVVACAESIDPDVLRRIAEESGEEVSIAQGRSWEVMNASDFIICKSGTSTLQAAIAGTPMVIVYKSDYLSYFLARTMTHVKWAGLPNLLAGRQVVPELIQGKMTPGNIARAVAPYLKDVSKRKIMRDELLKISASLGGPGASDRAAVLIVDYMKKFSSQ